MTCRSKFPGPLTANQSRAIEWTWPSRARTRETAFSASRRSRLGTPGNTPVPPRIAPVLPVTLSRWLSMVLLQVPENIKFRHTTSPSLSRFSFLFLGTHVRTHVRPHCPTLAVAPQILQFSFGDDPLNSGEMLSVSCTIVKGDFPVNLTWTFDDRPIDFRQPDVNIVNNKRVSFLSIDSVAARHAGRYKCTAANAAGFDSHTAVLSVNGSAYL